jgi:hypothetical protein
MIINQIHAIGDIMFLEPMFRHFWEKEGVKPIVPIRDHLMWLADHIESADFRKLSTFNWPSHTHGGEWTGVSYVDCLQLRWANQLLRHLGPDDHHDFENMMLDKYRFVGLDPMMWKNLKLTFNPKKAAELMAHLGITDKDEYILVNQHSQAGDVEIKHRWNGGNGMKVVYMESIGGFNVCDWFFVMMFAKEIHTVSTCTFYMMQAMTDLQAKIFIYPRPGIDGLRGISKLNPSFNYTNGRI